MDWDLERVKNYEEDGETYMHPLNVVAEVCFGKLSETWYQRLLDGYKGMPNETKHIKKSRQYIEKAIEMGLTYYDSLNDTPRAQEIWKIIHREEQIKEWFK